MATKLKVVEDVADIVLAPQVPEFEMAPTRKRHAAWTAPRHRKSNEVEEVEGPPVSSTQRDVTIRANPSRE